MFTNLVGKINAALEDESSKNPKKKFCTKL